MPFLPLRLLSHTWYKNAILFLKICYAKNMCHTKVYGGTLVASCQLRYRVSLCHTVTIYCHPVTPIQWSLYFKTTHVTKKMWSYIAGGLKIKVI